MTLKEFNHGFIVMKAMPFHNGHRALIDYALSHCRRVTVLVCTLPSEPIPGELRYNWVSETFENNSRVKVKWFSEIVPQLPEEDPINFWNIWTEIANIYAPTADVLVTSELYGFPYAQHIGIKHLLFDLDRTIVPVSGTKIRNNPNDNWQFIPLNVRPYYAKRIAILGAESCGKSRLTENLAKHFDCGMVPEIARTIIEANNNQIVADDFLQFSATRQAYEDYELSAGHRLIICDTEDITTYMWLQFYFPNDASKYDDYFAECFSRKRKYDKYILLTPDSPAIQDGSRRHLDQRSQVHLFLKNKLQELNCDFVEIGGSWGNRFNQSVKLINSIL